MKSDADLERSNPELWMKRKLEYKRKKRMFNIFAGLLGLPLILALGYVMYKDLVVKEEITYIHYILKFWIYLIFMIFFYYLLHVRYGVTSGLESVMDASNDTHHDKEQYLRFNKRLLWGLGLVLGVRTLGYLLSFGAYIWIYFRS
ncbi:hypothetical protein PVA45_05950 [Entomospira entomophila]|uniref:Uncharacterized protein n=1 Tax=Entomospira entomophila TaxID=2719988 RepID=A0A968KU37_9SPIO|nr:hypothetical protein [Entomospira entomophilus]NIZ41041.1 hypothetical protein [Entomospira entomophilus]WDI35251.1 hypothetical protein PVA45_05950 [Entomospira entomophilus]